MSALAACGSASAAEVASWGRDYHSQLGEGFAAPASNVPVPTLVSPKAVQVVTAGEWGAALLEDGTVETWGGNESGQMCDGVRNPYKRKPSVVEGLSDVVELAAGGEHLLARLANGTVAVCGANQAGQGGLGTRAAVLRPTVVPGVSNVVQVSAGGADDAALLSNGTVLCWGEDNKGQCGDGATGAGSSKDRPVLEPDLSGVKQIAIGGVDTIGAALYALLENGTVEAIGYNTRGELGNGTTLNSTTPVTVEGLPPVERVAANFSYAMALSADGTLYAWGNDRRYQLGTALPSTVCGSPKLVAPCATTALPVQGVREVTAFSPGIGFSVVVGNGDRVYAVGRNRYCTLGDGSREDSRQLVEVAGPLSGVSSVAAGEASVLALTAVAPSRVLSAITGNGTLTAEWPALAFGSEPLKIAFRRVSSPPLHFSPRIALPLGASSYSFTGLAAGEYEVGLYIHGQRRATALGIVP